jgi:hypothetical protein
VVESVIKGVNCGNYSISAPLIEGPFAESAPSLVRYAGNRWVAA